jgi:hypothetical protein
MNDHNHAACARSEKFPQPCMPPQSCEVVAAQRGTCHHPPNGIVNKDTADKLSQIKPSYFYNVA